MVPTFYMSSLANAAAPLEGEQMLREQMIRCKNRAVREVLDALESSRDADKLDPIEYNAIRNRIRFNFNRLLNEVFAILHFEEVPLKRERPYALDRNDS